MIMHATKEKSGHYLGRKGECFYLHPADELVYRIKMAFGAVTMTSPFCYESAPSTGVASVATRLTGRMGHIPHNNNTATTCSRSGMWYTWLSQLPQRRNIITSLKRNEEMNSYTNTSSSYISRKQLTLAGTHLTIEWACSTMLPEVKLSASHRSIIHLLGDTMDTVLTLINPMTWWCHPTCAA